MAAQPHHVLDIVKQSDFFQLFSYFLLRNFIGKRFLIKARNAQIGEKNIDVAFVNCLHSQQTKLFFNREVSKLPSKLFPKETLFDDSGHKSIISSLSQDVPHSGARKLLDGKIIRLKQSHFTIQVLDSPLFERFDSAMNQFLMKFVRSVLIVFPHICSQNRTILRIHTSIPPIFPVLRKTNNTSICYHIMFTLSIKNKKNALPKYIFQESM